MGKTVWKKLRSRKGASLIFALLAFLVCAVISAVLLASASAAAGRVSGLAESDRRYYAVNSAVSLFCDEMKAQSFVIEQKHEHTEYTKTQSVLDNGHWETTNYPQSPKNEYFLKLNDSEINSERSVLLQVSDYDFWKEAALFYVFGKSFYTITDKTALLAAAMKDSPNVEAKQWSIDFSVAGGTDMSVYALAFMDQRGNITVYFSNAPFTEITGVTAPAKKYYVKAEFAINTSMEYPYTPIDYQYSSSPAALTDETTVITVESSTKTTTIKKATVGWTVSSISTMEKAAVDAELAELMPAEENP